LIFKNTVGLIEKEDKAYVFAFQNKFILFEKDVNSLIIMDNSFTVIGTVILNSKLPPSKIRIASLIDSGALEFIDEFNSKFPLPILGNL
jgi:predicted ribosome-associated RNA-binding protein Tma20